MTYDLETILVPSPLLDRGGQKVMWLAVHPPDRRNAPAAAGTLRGLPGPAELPLQGSSTAPCSQPDRLRNALISPAQRQPPRTSHACLKPRQRGAVPGGQDGAGAGACAAPGALGRCQAGNPSRHTTITLGWGIPSCRKGHGQTTGDRPSSFHCAFVRCQAPSSGCVRYWEQRLEAGCIQLTPATSVCREERSPLFGNSSYSHKTTRGASARAKAGVRYKSYFAQKGTRPRRRSPRGVRSMSRQDMGRAALFSAGLSVWPGMKSQRGDVPLRTAPLSPPP